MREKERSPQTPQKNQKTQKPNKNQKKKTTQTCGQIPSFPQRRGLWDEAWWCRGHSISYNYVEPPQRSQCMAGVKGGTHQRTSTPPPQPGNHHMTGEPVPRTLPCHPVIIHHRLDRTRDPDNFPGGTMTGSLAVSWGGRDRVRVAAPTVHPQHQEKPNVHEVS